MQGHFFLPETFNVMKQNVDLVPIKSYSLFQPPNRIVL